MITHSKPSCTEIQHSTPDFDFPIVGIGASAGGLEALESFFRNVPDNCGMAFVVILHLDPTQKGMMPELLQRHTAMNVRSVTDRLKVMPDCVYVIPSNKSMSILHRTLYLFEPVESRGMRLPIDLFFSALADDLLEKSIGIILSGMGSDGTMGLRKIKEKSGLVLVQSPESAEFDGMPRSAIDAVSADFVAPADELPIRLVSFLKTRSSMQSPTVLPMRDKSALDKIVILLRKQTGHDFSLYKNNTLYRRIERRMGVHLINGIAAYVRYLQENPKEIEILFKELLIGVTHFFRDPQVWERLKEKILPAMITKLPDNHVFRAWIPACSTGEEVYSFAIIFKEVMDKIHPQNNIKLQIFATDLDQDAIAKARSAYFPESSVDGVSSRRLNQFFCKTENGYRINAEIREMVVFSPHNIIKDPPFTKLDFISCRNMMIYMEAELQMKLLSLFQYCLNPGGLLLIGNAETLGSRRSLFCTVDAKLRIFRRPQNVKTAGQIDFPSSFSHIIKDRTGHMALPKDPDNIQTLADQLLLQRFAPPSVMTNSKGDIIYITGRTGNYLEPAAGKANMNIFVMARDGLRNELSIAYRSAIHTNKRIVLNSVKVESNSGAQFVDIIVQKIEKPHALHGMIMVVFNEVSAAIETVLKKTKRKASAGDPSLHILEAELQSTKDELQLTIEAMQTSQEELKSTNEELQSTNEELQSTNEELTTSKEEMQSLNEELQTVNIELQNKVDDYFRINNDLKNLLDNTAIATLFLDKDLKIRRFTMPATKVFKLIPSDIGRPFTDIVTDLDYSTMASDATDVLRTLMFIEKSVSTHDGRWFSVRIMPYRTIDDRIEGLVITFTDISTTKKLEIELRNSNETLDSNLKEIQDLFHEKELILKEVHHRIKNNMNTILSLLLLQSRTEDSPVTKNTLHDAAGRIKSMMVLYDKLYRSEIKNAISIKEYFPALIEEIVSIFPQMVSIRINTHIEDIVLNAKMLPPLGIIINELITNAMKYAFADCPDCVISVSAIKKENRLFLTFEDNGSGIPESVTFENSTGFGLQLVKMLVKQINGSIFIEREKGTRYVMEFEV
ncbi:MAG TPA: chemotaxis protein CheB [Spirochaetota bacterium]